MKILDSKHCPRCNIKMPKEIVICPNCQLNFQKFESSTNHEAKERIKNGESDKVLMRVGRPSDVSFVKLLLMTIFLGFLGGHNYYVGRYKRGLFFSIFFAVGVINAVVVTFCDMDGTGILYDIYTLLVLVWGAVLALWIIDIAKVVMNKFKIPVSRY